MLNLSAVPVLHASPFTLKPEPAALVLDQRCLLAVEFLPVIADGMNKLNVVRQNDASTDQSRMSALVGFGSGLSSKTAATLNVTSALGPRSIMSFCRVTALQVHRCEHTPLAISYCTPHGMRSSSNQDCTLASWEIMYTPGVEAVSPAAASRIARADSPRLGPGSVCAVRRAKLSGTS